MPEYVERAKAAEYFEKSKKVMWHKDDAAATVSNDSIPAADVVEVVRCKDCGFIKETKISINKRPLRSCTLYKRPCYDDDFCSRGVKMDGEGE